MDKERQVRDIYHKGVILCRPDSPLQEVVRVMADTEVHAVMVTEREGEPPVGVVSHTDVIAHYGDDPQRNQHLGGCHRGGSGQKITGEQHPPFTGSE